jgi:hypothetical protein
LKLEEEEVGVLGKANEELKFKLELELEDEELEL